VVTMVTAVIADKNQWHKQTTSFQLLADGQPF